MRFSRPWIAIVAGLGLLVGSSTAARAEGLSADETARLERGETIVREQTIDNDERHFVGGITYTIVEGTVQELTSLFEDVSAYQRLLPKTKRARLVGINGPDHFVELVQGNALLETSYTIRVRAYPEIGEVRFWLDPTRPHGIDDAWGYFRGTELPDAPDGTHRALLTYGALVDLGGSLVGEMYEERLRALMLSVPQLVRRYVQRTLHGRPHT